MGERARRVERDRDREPEWRKSEREGERETDRQRERETERKRASERARESEIPLQVICRIHHLVLPHLLEEGVEVVVVEREVRPSNLV